MNKNTWVFIFCFFLLFFPKGGFKIQGIPITWGYILLGLFFIYWCLKKAKKIHNNHLQAYILTLPFQAMLIISSLLYGHVSTGAFIALIINTIFLPFVMFIVFSDSINNLDMKYFFKIFKKGVFFVASYGIFLFLFKFITGKFIEIPFLTTNFGDLGLLENKHINRGFLFKLISTYNNGNIYGICLLMLLPLYQYLENKKYRQLIVIFSLILTLSRTVWAGLLFVEFFFFIISKKSMKEKTQEFIIISLLFLCFGSLLLFLFPEISNLFLIDKILNLGGRLSSHTLHHQISLLPYNKISSISEMVYLSSIKSFGVIGLLLFIIGLSGPIIIYFLKKNKIQNEYSRYILLGIICYLFCANIEGAFIFIPTMTFYWTISALLIRNNNAFSSNEMNYK